MMNSFSGIVDGVAVATYKKGSITWICKITTDGFYCATFHVRKRLARTYYSKDKNEINELIRKALAEGFKKIS